MWADDFSREDLQRWLVVQEGEHVFETDSPSCAAPFLRRIDWDHDVVIAHDALDPDYLENTGAPQRKGILVFAARGSVTSYTADHGLFLFWQPLYASQLPRLCEPGRWTDSVIHCLVYGKNFGAGRSAYYARHSPDWNYICRRLTEHARALERDIQRPVISDSGFGPNYKVMWLAARLRQLLYARKQRAWPAYEELRGKPLAGKVVRDREVRAELNRFIEAGG